MEWTNIGARLSTGGSFIILILTINKTAIIHHGSYRKLVVSVTLLFLIATALLDWGFC